jgi:RND family efflux transporter MFP subunit
MAGCVCWIQSDSVGFYWILPGGNPIQEAGSRKAGWKLSIVLVRKTMNHKGYRVLAIGLLMVVLGVSGCSKPGSPTSTSTAAPMRVKTEKATLERRQATEEVVGTVRPKLSAVISAKITGAIEQMAVVPGQSVKAGDLLVMLDAREAQARVDQASAVLEQARSDIGRFSRLLADKVVTQQEYDVVKARERVAQASMAEVQTILSYTRITAPFDGVITRKYADVGDLSAPGKALLEMEAPGEFRLEADVPEAAMGRIALGEKMQVNIPAAAAQLEATVSEIAPAADTGSRTIVVKLDLPKGSGIRSGQFGRVLAPVADVEALRVPADSVIHRGQLEIMFVVADQKALMRLVKTGKKIGKQVEVVSGLMPGETYVVDGAAALTDGQAVEVQP